MLSPWGPCPGGAEGSGAPSCPQALCSLPSGGSSQASGSFQECTPPHRGLLSTFPLGSRLAITPCCPNPASFRAWERSPEHTLGPCTAAARGAVSPGRPQGLTCKVAPGVPAHSKAPARTLGGEPQPRLSPGRGVRPCSPSSPAPSRHTGSSARGPLRVPETAPAVQPEVQVTSWGGDTKEGPARP